MYWSLGSPLWCLESTNEFGGQVIYCFGYLGGKYVRVIYTGYMMWSVYNYFRTWKVGNGRNRRMRDNFHALRKKNFCGRIKSSLFIAMVECQSKRRCQIYFL